MINIFGDKMIIKKAKDYLKEAGTGFVLWTIFLTPYMILVTRVSSGQYISWLVMQAVFVPPIAVLVHRITNRLCK